MYFLLILFFGSLIGIIFMIGRKLAASNNGQAPYITYTEDTRVQTPFLEEWKHLTVKNLKKHSYAALVVTIRYYVRSSNLLKNKIKNIRNKNTNGDTARKREASGFLKMISEYKHKIRKIKRKIKEEENL
jgi:hypothetical protein